MNNQENKDLNLNSQNTNPTTQEFGTPTAVANPTTQEFGTPTPVANPTTQEFGTPTPVGNPTTQEIGTPPLAVSSTEHVTEFNKKEISDSNNLKKSNIWVIVILIILISNVFSSIVAFVLNTIVNLAISFGLNFMLGLVITNIILIGIAILGYFIAVKVVVQKGTVLEKNAPTKITNIIVIYSIVMLVVGILYFFVDLFSAAYYTLTYTSMIVFIIVNVFLMLINFAGKILFIKTFIKNILNKYVTN